MRLQQQLAKVLFQLKEGRLVSEAADGVEDFNRRYRIYSDEQFATIMEKLREVGRPSLTAFVIRNILSSIGLKDGELVKNPLVAVGCDPELELKIGRETIPGGDYFDEHELGHDGAYVPIEFRPPPGDGFTVSQHISRIMREMYDRICHEEDVRVLAGSGYSIPLGGHIHISGPYRHWRERIDFLDVELSQFLNSMSHGVRVIDRRQRGYGLTGEVRENDWGIEYRTPLSWLSTPTLTCGALTLAYLTFCMSNPPQERKDVLDYANPRERAALQAFWNYSPNVPLELINVLESWKIVGVSSEAPHLLVLDGSEECFLVRKPEDTSQYPSWGRQMDVYDGRVFPASEFTRMHDVGLWRCQQGYYFHESWLIPLGEAAIPTIVPKWMGLPGIEADPVLLDTVWISKSGRYNKQDMIRHAHRLYLDSIGG